MSRIDWLVLSRIAGRFGLTLVVFLSIFILVESLDVWRFRALSRIGGAGLAVWALIVNSVGWLPGTLPVTLLIGTIIGILDLQSRREFVIIKASGISIWRVMRAPLIATVLLGLFTAFLVEPAVQLAGRALPVPTRTAGPALWLEQTGSDGPYILYAQHPHADGSELEDVVLFMTGNARDRIEAPAAHLRDGAWDLDNPVRYRPDAPPQALSSLSVATQSSPGDLRLRMRIARDLTFGELVVAIGQQMADPTLRAAALTGLFRLLAMPATLCGSVLIAFAFTSAYRRTNKYGGTVLYGIVLGFVVYVVSELASHSGSAGVVDPAFASAGPAIVAIVVGLTVLLYKEDGRA
jgi:lipopolysaccharide export system permease protein